MIVYAAHVDDFLLLTEHDLGDRLRATLPRGRFAAKCAIELEDHASALSCRGRRRHTRTDSGSRRTRSSTKTSGLATIDDHELELLRIRAATPRYGRELDDRVLPAEAGLDVRAIDFEKGCYPGQEPIARQHYRGRVNRTLRVLELPGGELPEYDAELELEGKVIGRVTSATRDGDSVVALGYVRAEVPRDAQLRLGTRSVTQLESASPRP